MHLAQKFFFLGSYNFLAYLECVKSYTWSKGHSDPDLSSVMYFEPIKHSELMLKINNKDEGYITFLFDYILFTCNAYFRMNFLAKKITRKVPFNFILQAIYLLYLFSKLFTCIILLTNNESLNFPSKELTTKNPSDPILNSRAVGRSENPRGQSPPGLR